MSDTGDDKRPEVQLIGQDSNAFMIIGLCNRAMRKAGWSHTKREAMQERMLAAGSYDKLLQLVITEFDVS